MRLRYLLIFTVLFLLAACGPAQGPSTTEETETPSEPEAPDLSETPVASDTSDGASGEEQDAASPEAPTGPPEEFEGLDYTTTESGLQIFIEEEGSGDQPEPGDVVSVHYTGMLGDGTVFDSSIPRNEPLTFPLGRERVIRGWDEGIAMLSEGGKAKMIIPAALGYGGQGSGLIPPNSTLYFDVELVDVMPGGPDEPQEVSEDEFEETDSGLRYAVLEEGEGETVEEGQPVRMHYTAWLEDGTRIDSSHDYGEPVTFPLGSEQVFPGWNEAVANMNVGDKWQVVMPPELALGEQGAGELVPPNSTLIMELELVEILPTGPDEPAEVDEDDYTTTDSGLQYVDLEEGSGPEVREGDTVLAHYTGWLEDGTRFDSSYQRGEPFTVIVGMGQVIPGWDEGLVGMQAGGRRQLVIPPDLAYGATGAGGVIPGDATLTFEIEVLEVNSSTD